MNTEEILKRIDKLITDGDALIAGGDGIFVNGPATLGWKTGCLSFLEKVLSSGHEYYKAFDLHIKGTKKSVITAGTAILSSFRDEVTSGWFFSIKKLISAEIFSDFLEMAEYLLDEGYKDPAAVMIGSVLEEHLRQLCAKHSIPVTFTNPKGELVPKKADTLNGELSNAGVYGKLELKNITAWLDLRNKAAHGKYTEYTKEQVKPMHMGVSEFITRVTI